jgi:hypothetical protein
MGLDGPVTEADLDRLEAFYVGRRERCRLAVLIHGCVWAVGQLAGSARTSCTR